MKFQIFVSWNICELCYIINSCHVLFQLFSSLLKGKIHIFVFPLNILWGLKYVARLCAAGSMVACKFLWLFVCLSMLHHTAYITETVSLKEKIVKHKAFDVACLNFSFINNHSEKPSIWNWEYAKVQLVHLNVCRIMASHNSEVVCSYNAVNCIRP